MSSVPAERSCHAKATRRQTSLFTHTDAPGCYTCILFYSNLFVGFCYRSPCQEPSTPAHRAGDGLCYFHALFSVSHSTTVDDGEQYQSFVAFHLQPFRCPAHFGTDHFFLLSFLPSCPFIFKFPFISACSPPSFTRYCLSLPLFPGTPAVCWA